MNWFRTIRGLVRPMIAALLVAQLAGVVSFQGAHAQPLVNVVGSPIHHHEGHHHGDAQKTHHGGDQIPGDRCCALHAFFAAVLPPAIVISTATVIGQRVAAGLDERRLGVPPDRLERPPRPLLLI